jgi:threonine synthase
MAATWERTGLLIDPHTAVALAAARQDPRASTEPMVVLATAHPAKFPDAVEKATGERPELPSKLAGLMNLAERYDVLPNNLVDVQNYIAGSSS